MPRAVASVTSWSVRLQSIRAGAFSIRSHQMYWRTRPIPAAAWRSSSARASAGVGLKPSNQTP